MHKQRLETAQLGRTGIAVTRFAAGGHFTYGPSSHKDHARRVRELNHLLDLGVNYFDVQWEPEEIATAEVMRTRGKDFAVAWPLHGVTQAQGDLTAKYIIDYCDDHRRRFGIEHVDILLWVALELYEETEQKVMANVREAFATLKARGFCDHLAFSCHHSPDMALRAITRFNDFDVMMVPYSPLHPAADRGLLATAKANGVGTVGMKPFGGGGGFLNKVWAKETALPAIAPWHGSSRPYEAAIRWVLQNKDLDCTVPGMHSIQQMDELYHAVAMPFNSEDAAILETMKSAMDRSGIPVQLHDLGQPRNAWG